MAFWLADWSRSLLDLEILSHGKHGPPWRQPDAMELLTNIKHNYHMIVVKYKAVCSNRGKI